MVILDKKALGSRDGAVVRALTFHQCSPGSIPVRCHYVGWGCCCFSPGFPVFLPQKEKKQFSKFKFDKDSEPAWKPAKADMACTCIKVYEVRKWKEPERSVRRNVSQNAGVFLCYLCMVKPSCFMLFGYSRCLKRCWQGFFFLANLSLNPQQWNAISL